MKQTVLKYGLRAGGILSALMVINIGGMRLLGVEDQFGVGGLVIGYTTMVLSFILIHFGIRSYRDTVMGGSVRYWPALRVGLLIALIASACYAATWQVVYRTMLPDFAEKYGAQAVKQAQDRGAPAAEVEKVRSEMAQFAISYKNPLYNFGMTILEPAPVGILFSLISAGILSRKRKNELGVLGGATA
jgi:hypothetical protein